jgi:SAM-dependent methyltransferase
VQHVGRLPADAKILDFGIGWGRIIRFFLKDVDTGGLHGVDVRSDFIEICRLARLPVQIIQTTPTGTLPYPKDFFDIVYAYSVFTHLPEDMQHLWLAEIARVLRPGGLFVATVQPPRFLHFCRSIDEKAAAESGWLAALRNHVKSRTHLDEDLARDGIIYFPSGGGPALPSATYGDIILSPNYIKTHWSTCFRVIEVLDDPARFTQAVVTAVTPVTLWGKLSAIFRSAPH